jgi:hypothetical protein
MHPEITFEEVIGRLEQHLPGEVYIEIAVNDSILVDLQGNRAELKRPDGAVAVHLNSFTNVQLPHDDFASAYDIGPDDNGVPRLQVRFGAVKYEVGFMDSYVKPD